MAAQAGQAGLAPPDVPPRIETFGPEPEPGAALAARRGLISFLSWSSCRVLLMAAQSRLELLEAV
eukprot:697281-Alexandrium_andersonii.AAC.1